MQPACTLKQPCTATLSCPVRRAVSIARLACHHARIAAQVCFVVQVCLLVPAILFAAIPALSCDTIFVKPAPPRRRPLGVLWCSSALLTPAGCSQQLPLRKQVQDWPVRHRADTIGHAARMPACAAASKVAEKAPTRAAAPFAGLKLHPGALAPRPHFFSKDGLRWVILACSQAQLSMLCTCRPAQQPANWPRKAAAPVSHRSSEH